MPFQSQAQQRAAFSGALGPEMKAKAPEFARATPNIKALPQHVKPMGGNHPAVRQQLMNMMARKVGQ